MKIDVRRWLNQLAWPWGWVLLGGGAIVVSVLVFWLVTWLARESQRTADANAGREFGAARSAAGRDAINTINTNQRGADAIDARVKGSEDAVRSAPADQRDDVALRELCKSPSAGDQPQCRMLKPRP